MTTLHFNEALQMAAKTLRDADLPETPKVRLIRDVYGRLRFALDCPLDDYPAAALITLQQAQAALGVYATSAEVLTHDSFSNPEAVFGSADWHRTLVELGANEDGESLGTAEIFLLDRQITGQDWLRPPAEGGTAHPHRFVFFGLKGGVGRSTALCMTAWGLAERGKKVLLIDFDLESPGLSSLVLPANKGADFGVVDWLMEDAVGQGDAVLPRMVSASPLAETTVSAIRVAAAMGVGESNYLAKLSRAYADVPGANGPKRMGARMREMVEKLEAQEKPDVVLIDSRAGLHDLAAVSITSLADTALLFATGGAQSWNGYRQLFSHWQHSPDVAKHVRERLLIVRALTPKTDREASVRGFQRSAYELFSESLYDELPAEMEEDTLFHPGEKDESAPHFPILVDWDERFQEFDPMLRPEDGGATRSHIEGAFGQLIDRLLNRLNGETE
jgi:cellulose biosynthesis protein BcsQ